jgi:hypothetical protein
MSECVFDRGWRKALDYALPLNGLTVCSAILKVENEPSKIPAVHEIMGIFEFQNPGVFRDERRELM